MKYLILLFPLFLIACGETDSGVTTNLKQECDANSDFTNAWLDQDLNELYLGPDCFGGTRDACDHRFKYYKPVGGKMAIEVNSSANNPSCLPAGEAVCDFLHTDVNGPSEQLILNCGKGAVIYFAGGTI